MLDHENEPHIMDFGLAKREADEVTMTVTGQMLGTPAYMSPEQAGGDAHKADRRSDVYSLGVILFELLTGERPFRGDSRMLIHQVLTEQAPSPRKLNGNVPKDIETITLKCLEKNPQHRFAEANSLSEELQRWTGGEPIRSRPISRVEKTWRWCRRNPTIPSVATSSVLLMAIALLVFQQIDNSRRGLSLVEQLRTANPSDLMEIIEETDKFRRWTTPRLQSILSEQPGDDARATLHAQLALVAEDESQVPPLKEALLAESDPTYVSVITKVLAPQQISSELWSILHDESAQASRRFRAGLALAGYEAAEQWTADDFVFLVERLVASNPVNQPTYWDLLSAVGPQLIQPLESVFLDEQRPVNELLASANAVARFAADQPERLSNLLVVATPSQYEILYLVVSGAGKAALAPMRTLVKQQPGEDLSEANRVTLGKQRAGAAITLLRQGDTQAVLDTLRVTDDPEASTQFVHRCRARGVSPGLLLDVLEEAIRLREAAASAARKVQDRVLYGLLLSLGEFQLEEIPASRRQAVTDRLVDWYATHPSAAVHGATGWLLRQMGGQRSGD